VRAGWGSGEFERLHGYDGERASFRSPTNLASSAAFAEWRSRKRRGVAGSDDHDGERARLSGWGHGDDPVYRQQQLLGRRDDHGVPSATTFQYAHTGADIGHRRLRGGSAGVCRGAGQRDEHAPDRHCLRQGREGGSFNNFFDLWDDENATIEHFNNQAKPLNNNTNWTGSFVFSAGTRVTRLHR